MEKFDSAVRELLLQFFFYFPFFCLYEISILLSKKVTIIKAFCS